LVIASFQNIRAALRGGPFLLARRPLQAGPLKESLMSDTQLTRPDEAIALRLIQAIRADAEARCAPDQVDLVSVTFDVAAAGAEPSALSYKPRVDRKTRTILFTGGSAESARGIMMTATAVYRITPQA
jgi:hypothetical protein